MFNTAHPKLGVALGGGAILGAAHLGVLKALEEHQKKPDMLTGTSIGAVMAALYGFGMTPEAIKQSISDLDWWDVSNFAWSRFGLLSNAKMGKFLSEHINNADFSEAQCPLAFIATDVCTGEKVILDQGSVAEAAMISACVPGLFTPYERGDKMLVDGGLIENVPVSPLKAMGADFILAVDLNGSSKARRPEDIIDVLINALDIAIDSHTHEQLRAADYVLSLDLGDYNRTSPAHINELYQAGYQACSAHMAEIEKAMERASAGLLKKLTGLDF